MKKVVIIILFLIFDSTAMAQDDLMKGPWQGPVAKDTRHQGLSQLSSTSAFLIRFFRGYISPIDGSACPMYPSCSQYGVESLEKHGLLVGWAMTWDRLYRCGRDELRLSPRVIVNGQQRCYDPPKNNDFWWYDGK
jgi:putative membrane protein insertion efficiency factor